MSKSALEPVGDLKFGPPEDGPIVAESTWEDWQDWAMTEYEISRRAVPVLNSTDEELEALIRNSDDIDQWIDLVEAP